MANAVDHVVLPTGDLSVSRSRMVDLGFTVAPDALHPFGTKNACVFFSDGTYLEPLAVVQREACELAALAGNVFIKRDQAYRFRQGEEGFSALVMKTDDAAADRVRFESEGISAGPNLEFSRPFETPSGEQATASFALAFAADLRSPDVFFFNCQRINPPAVDRTALERHSNGVTAIGQIILSEHNPSDFQYLLQQIVDQREVNAHSFGIELASGNADIIALNHAGLKGYFGTQTDDNGRGLRLRAVVFKVAELARLEADYKKAGIDYSMIGARLVVQPELGQGAIFAFEQI